MLLFTKHLNQILHCDCVEGMGALPDACIPLTVTSPPYDQLRFYGGHPFVFEPIAQELVRVTQPGGVIVWIVQDHSIAAKRTARKRWQTVWPTWLK